MFRDSGRRKSGRCLFGVSIAPKFTQAKFALHSGATSISGVPEIASQILKSATADLVGVAPGIHNPLSANMDSGLLAYARPRNDERTTRLERDELWLDWHPALAFCLSMIFSENRSPLFRIMLQTQDRGTWRICALRPHLAPSDRCQCPDFASLSGRSGLL